jgi:chaperonin GroES
VRFRPLQDRVLIRRIEEEEKTVGGIIIPDTAKEKPMEGEIIAAGPGARSDDGKVQPLDVKVGDRVLFGKWSGTEIKIDGEDFVVAKESDIMGVVEEVRRARTREGRRQWRQKKSGFIPMRASGCCAASTFCPTR